MVLSYFSSFVLEEDQVEQSSNIISVMLRKVHAITQSIYLFKTKNCIWNTKIGQNIEKDFFPFEVFESHSNFIWMGNVLNRIFLHSCPTIIPLLFYSIVISFDVWILVHIIKARFGCYKYEEMEYYNNN